MWRLLAVLLSSGVVGLCGAISSGPPPVGLLYGPGDEAFVSGFRLAASKQPRLITPYSQRLEQLDPVTLSQTVCGLYQHGAVLLVAPPAVAAMVESYSTALGLPLVSAGSLPPRLGVALGPPALRAALDLARFRRWENLVLLVAGHDRNEGIHPFLQNLRAPLEAVVWARSPREALDRLREFSGPHAGDGVTVMLDSDQSFAKELLTDIAHDPESDGAALRFVLLRPASEEFWDSLMAANVTGFMTASPERLRTTQFRTEWAGLSTQLWPGAGTPTLPEGASLGHDTALVVHQAYFTLLRTRGPLLETRYRDCLEPAHGSDRFLQDLLLKVRLENGLTGHVEFDSSGARRNFQLDILASTGSGTVLQIGTWKDNQGLVSNWTVDESRLDLPRRSYKFVSYLAAPYLMINSTGGLEGFMVDLAEELGDRLQVEWELEVAEGPGNFDPTSRRWNGAVGELIDGKADLLLGPLPWDLHLTRVVALSTPLQKSRLTLLVQRPGPSSLDPLSPLTPAVWGILTAVALAMGPLLYLISRWTLPPPRARTNLWGDTLVVQKPPLTLLACFWATWGRHNLVFPWSVSSRALLSVWWLFQAVVLALYLANYSVNVALRALPPSADRYVAQVASKNALSLFQESARYGSPRIGFVVGNGPERLVQEGGLPEVRRWLASLSAFKLRSIKEGLEKVRESKGGFVLAASSTEAEFLAGRAPCDLTVAPGSLAGERTFHLASRLRSAFGPYLDGTLEILRENGKLRELEDKWWPNECFNVVNKPRSSVFVWFQDISNMSYVFVGWLVLVALLTVLEHFFRQHFDSLKYRRATRKRPLRSLDLHEQEGLGEDNLSSGNLGRSKAEFSTEQLPPPPTEEELKHMSL